MGLNLELLGSRAHSSGWQAAHDRFGPNNSLIALQINSDAIVERAFHADYGTDLRKMVATFVYPGSFGSSKKAIGDDGPY
jgi:hypothetical protein